MNVLDELYPEGTDYEWFAIDAKEQVARFTTAGIGPVLEEVLQNINLSDALMSFVQELPIRGGSLMLTKLPAPYDFIKSARQGFFSYDWADVHRNGKDRTGVYELFSRPEKPITLSDLPEKFSGYLRRACFSSLHFDTSDQIDVRILLPSIGPHLR